MATVSLQNLTKIFDSTVAVKNLNLKVDDKEFLTLLGPSGCGKTTTLRMVAGLETPTGGDVYINDVLVTDRTPGQRDVAMVFQTYALYPFMRVYDNIAVPLKVRKVAKDEIDRRVKKAAEMLRISHLLDRKPKQLSGGEAQRVALARAIVRQPQVFLLDEPLSNLDAKLRIYMRSEIKTLQRALGVTTIYVTHDQVEAMTMSDRIAVMNKGELLQLDTPQAIYSSPTDVFVAGFIGSPPMNLIDCSFVESDSESYLDAGPVRLNADKVAEIAKKSKNSELVLGVRPEDVLVYTEERSGCVKFKISVSEPLGRETLLDLRSGEVMIKAIVGADFQATIGEEASINFNWDKVHLFDRQSGKTLL